MVEQSGTGLLGRPALMVMDDEWNETRLCSSAAAGIGEPHPPHTFTREMAQQGRGRERGENRKPGGPWKEP